MPDSIGDVERALELQDVESVQIAANIVDRPFKIKPGQYSDGYLIYGKIDGLGVAFSSSDVKLCKLILKVLNIYANSNRK